MTNDAPAPPCPICAASGARRTVYRLRAFDVVECPRCGGLQRDPLPGDAEMESYYRDPGYLGGGYFSGDDGEGPEIAIYREALDVLEARRRAAGHPAAGRVLDVGAGSGSFLEVASSRGWQADGVELSPELAARARERSGARVFEGDFAAAGDLGGGYDAVTMWDVLEHTADPGAFLDRARSVLARDGVLVVFTIDAASLFNVVAHLGWRLSGGRLSSPLELLYDKRHNHYFTSASLAALLERHGFAVDAAETHRAHLGRWLSEPASAIMLAGAGVLDLLSVPLGRPYRQLLYCVVKS